MTTNANKINFAQKTLLAAFMEENPNLAKNHISNCAQGKATSIRLWEELSRKLNSEGPPTKAAKLWRKAYGDQKYHVKKKLSFNKWSRKKTGGGPFEEKFISEVDDQIPAASGIEPAVEGINAKTFGSSGSACIPTINSSPPVSDCHNSDIGMLLNSDSSDDIPHYQEQIPKKIFKKKAIRLK